MQQCCPFSEMSARALIQHSSSKRKLCQIAVLRCRSGKQRLRNTFYQIAGCFQLRWFGLSSWIVSALTLHSWPCGAWIWRSLVLLNQLHGKNIPIPSGVIDKKKCCEKYWSYLGLPASCCFSWPTKEGWMQRATFPPEYMISLWIYTWIIMVASLDNFCPNCGRTSCTISEHCSFFESRSQSLLRFGSVLPQVHSGRHMQIWRWLCRAVLIYAEQDW